MQLRIDLFFEARGHGPLRRPRAAKERWSQVNDKFWVCRFKVVVPTQIDSGPHGV